MDTEDKKVDSGAKDVEAIRVHIAKVWLLAAGGERVLSFNFGSEGEARSCVLEMERAFGRMVTRTGVHEATSRCVPISGHAPLPGAVYELSYWPELADPETDGPYNYEVLRFGDYGTASAWAGVLSAALPGELEMTELPFSS